MAESQIEGQFAVFEDRYFAGDSVECFSTLTKVTGWSDFKFRGQNFRTVQNVDLITL